MWAARGTREYGVLWEDVGSSLRQKEGGGGRVAVVSIHPERGLGVPVAQRWGPEPLPHMSHNPR